MQLAGDKNSSAESPAAQRSSPSVYVELDDMIRLGPSSRGVSFRPRQPAHSILRGQTASRLRGPGLDFEELRAYLPGDDVRAIDWRVTARARTPFVRVYREEKERPVLVVVDQRASMFFGSVRDMKSVTAARAAAVVAHRVVAAGDRIGGVIFGDERAEVLAPQRSQRQVMRLLGRLRDFNHALGAAESASIDESGLDRALERVLRLSTHDHLVVLISDLTGAGPDTKKLATRIRRRNDLMILWVHDPLESQLPDVGLATLGDGRLQVQVDTGSRAIRARFAEDVEDRRTRASSLALHYDVPLLPLGTERDVVLQLRRMLSAGEGQRG